MNSNSKPEEMFHKNEIFFRKKDFLLGIVIKNIAKSTNLKCDTNYYHVDFCNHRQDFRFPESEMIRSSYFLKTMINQSNN